MRGNPTSICPQNDPAKSEDEPCEQTQQPDTQGRSGQLSTAGRRAPDDPEPQNREVRPDTQIAIPTGSEEAQDGLQGGGLAGVPSL